MAPQNSVLALLAPSVAQCPAGSGSSGGQRGDEILKTFGSAHAGSTSLHFGDTAALRFNGCGTYNRQFASRDDIFCVFIGSLDNLCQLRQAYGLVRSRVTEVELVLEMYKALRDRAPFPVSQAISEMHGFFSFILFDHRDKAALVAMDGEGRYPFYWGTCQDGTLALSDDVDLLRQGCKSSFAPFPPGCYFSTVSGLKIYMHPELALKAVPHIDSATGRVCGSRFEVDPSVRAEPVAFHVGSYHDLSAL